MEKIEFLAQVVLWGVSIWQLLLASLVIFAGFLSRRIILGFLKSWLTKRTEKTTNTWDDAFVERVPAPLAALAQIALWHVAAGVLALPTEPIDVATVVFQGLEIAFAIALLWLLMRIIDVLAEGLKRFSETTESTLDDQLVPLVRKTLKVIVAVMVAVMVVQNLGYSVSSILASLGIGGLAIALAAQDTVANLFGSVVVFTDRPFQIGDWVEFDGIEGTVEEVGFRTSRIRRFDKSLVTVPNKMFSTTPIINHSLRTVRRIKMTIGVTYDTNAEQMQTLLDALRTRVAEHPGIDQNFHFVHFVEFNSSSLDIQFYCFTKSTVWTTFLQVQEELMLQTMQTVESLGLEMAFPTRTLYLKQGDPQPETEKSTD